MPPPRTIIAILGPAGTDFDPVLPFLQHSGKLEVQGSVVYIDAGVPVAARRLRKKLLLLRSTIQAILNVPVRIGTGTTKSISIIAARQIAPGGLAMINPGDETSFLERVVIDLLPGIGRRTATYLRNRGVTTIGKFARLPQTAAVQLFGISGLILSQFSQGTDPREVVPTSTNLPPITGRRSLFSLFGKTPSYSTLAGMNSR